MLKENLCDPAECFRMTRDGTQLVARIHDGQERVIFFHVVRENLDRHLEERLAAVMTDEAAVFTPVFVTECWDFTGADKE